MRKGTWLAAIMTGALLLVTGASTTAAPAGGAKGPEVRLVIDGRVVGSFTEVSGLGVEVAQVAAVCRKGGGVDDDCDGVAWESAVRKALWELKAAADELEREAWALSRSRQDALLHGIASLKSVSAHAEEALNLVSNTMKGRHDTVKNSIGNIRAMVRTLNETASGDDGAHQAAFKAMEAAVESLTGLTTEWTVRYRPGRPVFGNITLRGALGATSDPVLSEWLRKSLSGVTDRKSGSIIYLDRGGNEVARYNFYEAWPCRWKAPELNASADTHLVEEIEFVVERIER